MTMVQPVDRKTNKHDYFTFFIWDTPPELSKFPHSFFFLPVTPSSCPCTNPHWSYPLSIFISFFFILPLLTSLPLLSPSSSFLIPPLPVFPRTHIFIEPSRPWTSTHCNNAAIMQLGREIAGLKCVWKCEILRSQNNPARCHPLLMP